MTDVLPVRSPGPSEERSGCTRLVLTPLDLGRRAGEGAVVRLFRRGCVGFFGLQLALVLTAAIAAAVVTPMHRRRVTELRGRIAQVRAEAEQGAGRPTPWPAPEAGDSVPRYIELLRAVAVSRASDPVGAADLAAAGRIGPHLDDDQPLDPPAERFVARHVGAAFGERLVEAVQHERCTWPVDLELGLGAPVTDLQAARGLAMLVSLEGARAERPDDALRYAVATIALGRDLERRPSLIDLMVGRAVRGLGINALERALARPQAAAHLRSASRAIAALRPAPPWATFELERLACGATIAALSGHPVDPDRVPAPGQVRVPDLGRFTPVLCWREWAVYDEHFDRQLAIAREPRGARRARAQAALDELHDSWTLLPRLLVTDLSSVIDTDEEGQVQFDLIRLLLAARLFEAERGAPPSSETELVPEYLAELPLDALAVDGRPLGYAVVDGELRCWSVGRDGVDDGGEGPRGALRWKEKDVVLRAPVR